MVREMEWMISFVGHEWMFSVGGHEWMFRVFWTGMDDQFCEAGISSFVEQEWIVSFMGQELIVLWDQYQQSVSFWAGMDSQYCGAEISG